MEFTYLERGDPKGIPLVFLHGWLGSKEDFLPLIEALGDDYYCLAVDLPGHGGTPLFAEEEELWMATIIKLGFFLRHQGLKKASFVGYSMGGRILLRFHEHFGHLVDQLFILSSHLGGGEVEEEKWVKLLKEGDMDEFLLKWYAQPLFVTLRLDVQLLERRRRNDPEKLAKALCGFSLRKQRQYEAGERMWFFYGEHDVKDRELYKEIVSRQEIQGGGHAIHLEKPLQMAELIKKLGR